MYKKDQRISLIFIGIGIGMFITAVLLFASFYIYIDLASSDERIGIYYDRESIDNTDEKMNDGNITQNQDSYMGSEELGTDSGIKSESNRTKETKT